MNAVIPILLKVTLVLAIAGLAAALLTRTAAAVRHLIWLAAIVAVLLLPAAAWLAPDWTPVREVALTASSTPRIVVDVVAGAAFPLPGLGSFLIGIWLAGAGFVSLRFVSSHRKAAALAAQSSAFLEDGSVRISGEIAIPLVCGILRPVIVLPETARAWPGERLRVVLVHEAMHVQRRDLLWQALAQCACVLYWFHPLVWWAASRLRLECEQACDDGVLAQGERASDYAGHLVEVVRGITAEPRMTEGAIAMARFSELEQRLSALFHPNRGRGAASGRIMTITAAAAVAVLIPLAALRAPAQYGAAAIAGVVRDASGAAVPKADVTVYLHGSDRREFTKTNEVGEFSLSPVPEGRYKVTVAKPGFALVTLEGIEVSMAQPQRLSISLAMGQIRETLTVAAEAPKGGIAGGAAAGVPGGAPQRIKVGGNAQAPKMIARVNPVYPPACKAEGVEGSVLLRTVISKTGEPLELKALNELVDKRLVDAAVEAVRQWRWQPTLLNGNPVEIITEVMINFTLAK
ncbi:MAG: TonB family protein [Bryobacteraceae bacterium]|nr:TonB family protein [Bryobacteraceae bacterium]